MNDTDVLSPLASALVREHPNAYEKLVVRGDTPAAARERLGAVTPADLLAVPVRSFGNASAMLCGLWLWHDGLSECHHIAQQSPRDLKPPAAPRQALGVLQSGSDTALTGDDTDIAGLTATLSFWHAIMHRREGDFSNSQYWYARAAAHPILQAIGAEVGHLVNPLPADKSVLRLLRGGWSPDAFVDLVEEISARPTDPRLAIVTAIQRVEWRMLFEHCTRRAAGG